MAVLLAFMDGIGIVVYLAAWVLIPLHPKGELQYKSHPSSLAVLGGILVIIGLFFLLKRFIDFDYIWPFGIIALGFYFLGKKK